MFTSYQSHAAIHATLHHFYSTNTFDIEHYVELLKALGDVSLALLLCILAIPDQVHFSSIHQYMYITRARFTFTQSEIAIRIELATYTTSFIHFGATQGYDQPPELSMMQKAAVFDQIQPFFARSGIINCTTSDVCKPSTNKNLFHETPAELPQKYDRPTPTEVSTI